MVLLPVRRAVDVQTISRNPDDHIRERAGDIRVHARSLDPNLHPFAQSREYTRALNAVKIERLFAKPFVAAFDDHRDGVYCLTRIRHSLPLIASGAGDGEIKCWHLSSRKCEWTAKAHTGAVKQLASDHTGKYLFSCSPDASVKMWAVDQERKRREEELEAEEGTEWSVQPSGTWLNDSPLHAVDCKADEGMFATASSSVHLYDVNRSSPIHSFTWGADSLNTLKFSAVETNIVASSASDRSIVLYDTRSRTPLQKIILLMQTNSIDFSPMDAYYFVTGGEDNNAYTFDMRRLDHACMIHSDHMSAVMSVAYSPTGAEFATGSYDRTVRIFKSGTGSSHTLQAGENAHSREIYHAKRMQRVFDVTYTADAAFVCSASDDAVVRLWRANASQKPGIQTAREKTALDYREKLIERFEHAPEVHRIHKHRHVPKAIFNARKRKAEQVESERRKSDRRRQHSKPGQIPHVSVKKRAVRVQVE